MYRERLFIPVLLVLLALVGLALLARPSTPPAEKASVAPALGLPQANQAAAPGGAETAAQTRDRWAHLAAGWVGPQPPSPPVLLAAAPVKPSFVKSVLNLPYVPPSPMNYPEIENEASAPKPRPSLSAPAAEAPALVLGAMPTPTLTFDGLSNSFIHPPDTNGDVGPDYVMEAVNTSIGIYTKTTGTLAAPAFTFNSIWLGANTGTPCDTSNDGDPIALYDTIHQHWIFMDFSWTDFNNGPYYFCFAVSQTSDPRNDYALYAIRADDDSSPFLPDYPKGGIWPDGLYFSSNMFDCSSGSCFFQKARAYAFNLQKMEAGQALTGNDTQAVDQTGVFTLMPSNVRGALPPAGTPDYYVTEVPFSGWDVYKYHVDFTNPLSSTFSGPTTVSQDPYTTAAQDVPEPSPGNQTDTLFDRMMFLNQYRNIGGTESLWVQHTTGTESTSTPTGIQWAQINVTGGTIHTTPVQQQIYNNGADGLNRFMASLAVDKLGDAALGFTASSATTPPDIRYVGRLAGDPLNQMPQGETTMLPGVTRHVQTGSCNGTCTRWGDYSAMTVDPVDDCTFWYANMYFPVTGSNWVTRIGSFKFPSCTGSALSSTTTSLTASLNPSVFGQAVTLTATVAISGGGAGTPTGLVTFSIDGSPAGTAPLSSGVATFTTSSLSAGSHPISAAYGGDANFSGSVGHLAPDLTVNTASTNLSVASSQNPASVGQVVTLTVTATTLAPGAGTPTGVVTLKIDGSTVSTATLSSGAATFTTSSLSVGTHPISAVYSGAANFNGGTGDLAPDLTVNKADTSVSVASSANPAVFGPVVTFTATVAPLAPGAGTPTGVVTFTIDGSAVGPFPLSGGAVTLPAGLSVGTHPISATFGGDANFNGSAGALVPDQAVNQAATTVTVASSQNPALVGQVVTFTVTVAPAASAPITPSGLVTFTIDGSTVSTATLSSGIAVFATASLALGTHPVSATYGGDGNFTGSAGALVPDQVIEVQFLLDLPLIMR